MFLSILRLFRQRLVECGIQKCPSSQISKGTACCQSQEPTRADLFRGLSQDELKDIIARCRHDILNNLPKTPGFKSVEVSVDGQMVKFKIARLYKVGNKLRYHDKEVE